MKKLSYILLLILFSSCSSLHLFNKEKRNQKKLSKIRLESPQLFESKTDTVYQIDSIKVLIEVPEKGIDTAFEWKNGEKAWEWALNDKPDDQNTYTWTDFEWLVNESKEMRDSTGKLEAILDVKLNKNRLRTDLKVIHHRDTFVQTVFDTTTKIVYKETIKTGSITRTPWYLYALIGALGIIIVFLFLKRNNKKS
jgi:hypothetical protein